MGYLLQILLALGAIGLAEGLAGAGPPGRDAEIPGLLGPLGALSLAIWPYAVAAWTRARGLRGRFRLAAAGQRALDWSAPVLHLLALTLFGWHALVLGWTGTSSVLLGWPGPALLLSLLPFALYQLAAIDARSRLAGGRPGDADRMRRFQVRMFLSAVLPLVAFVLLSWSVSVSEVLRVHVEQVALYNTAFAAFLIAVFALFLPTLLRNTWATAPLERGLQRQVLEIVARAADFRYRELLVWRTGHLVSNAVIVGLTPRQRTVLFSDALLDQLDLRQLAAVFAHEIGHARRHHILVFACWTLGFFLGADALLTTLEPRSWELATGLFAALLLAWYAGFGYLSRRFELDADLHSVEVTGDTESLVAALERVVGLHARRVTSWRHFSTADRVLFLRAAARDPGVARRLRRDLRRWIAVGMLLFAAGLAFEVHQLTASLGVDRVLVDLRLGRYASAEGRVAAGVELEPDLQRLVERGARLQGARGAGAGPGTPTPGELEEAAGRALAADRPEEALELLDLAILRGREELRQVARAIDRALGEEPAAVEELLAELGEPWAPRLAAWLEARSAQ